MNKALPTHLPDANRPPTRGATFYWVEDLPTLDARALQAGAADRGLFTEPGCCLLTAFTNPGSFSLWVYHPLNSRELNPGVVSWRRLSIAQVLNNQIRQI